MFATALSTLAYGGLPKRTLGALSVAFALTGCISPIAGSDGQYTSPIGSAPVIDNETPYSAALRCLASHIPADQRAIRIAVGNIRDYTGKEEADGSGRKLTQGASLMAMSALGKAGVPLVERFDTSVTELELKYTNNKLIGDADENAYRQIYAGEIRGSDYYLVGGITELNFNIRSGGISASVASTSPTGGGGDLSGNILVMNIGLDLRLVNSRTLEVVDFVSYQKQLVGHEVSAGVFDFLGGKLFQLGAGTSALEPLQLGVRSVIERAVLKMLVPLYRADPTDCASFGGKGDPMGAIDYRPASPGSPVRPSPVRERQAESAPAAVEKKTALRDDSDPYAYYSDIDNSGLRGQVN